MPRQMVRIIMEMPRGVRDVNWMLNAPRLITSDTSWSHADMCIQSRGMKNKKNEVKPELCEGGDEGDVAMT
jgi:hypothetical protein